MKQSSRSQLRITSGPTLILVVSVAILCLLLRKAEERKTFIGKIDPRSGYRCSLTLSPYWVPVRNSASLNGVPLLERYTVTYSPSAVRQWFNIHLLHRSIGTPPWIDIAGGSKKAFDPSHILNGFPEPLLFASDRIVTERHFLIDNQPATLVTTYEGSYHVNQLLVYLPDQAMMYTVIGGAEPQSFDLLDQEMHAIISSFRVEHVIFSRSPSDVRR